MSDYKNIEKKFTALDDEIFEYIKKKKIEANDIVVYTIIHNQNNSGFDTTGKFMSKIFNIGASTITNSTRRLEEAGLIRIKYGSNGKMICSLVIDEPDSFIKIPNGILYSHDIHIKEKSFLICIWESIVEDIIPYNKGSLHSDVFSVFGKGRRWVSGIVDSLTEKGVLIKENGKTLKIDLSKIVDLSESVIDNISGHSISLIDQNNAQEDMLNSYEKKTGIPRDNILDWDTEVLDDTKKFNSPKWMLPVIDAINKGADCLNKRPFVFNSSEFSNIGKHIREIIEKRDGDSDERCINVIVDSIKWKASQASRNDSEKKYYTKGFFSRAKKNNIASNLYHFEEYRKNMVCPTEQKFPEKAVKKVVNKKVKKKEVVVFDYGENM